MRGDFDEDELDATVDEPTIILAAEAYAKAYRVRLALKRAGRCIRPRDEHDEAACWKLILEPEEICANCKARVDEGAYQLAARRLQNAKRKLHRALGIGR